MCMSLYVFIFDNTNSPMTNSFNLCMFPTSLGTEPVNSLFDNKRVSSILSCPNSVGIVPVNALLAIITVKETFSNT